MPSVWLETRLELWSTTLRQAKQRLRPLFAAPSVAASANAFVDGLLGGERRKTGWMRAEAAGDPGRWRQQAILGRTQWDAEALRDVVRDYAIETLSSPEAVLVIDETGFLKQGKASCGGGRQYTGSAGKITNCQIGVFAHLGSGPRLHRSSAVPAQGLDRGAGPNAGRACSRGDRLFYQAAAGTRHDRADDPGRGAVCVGGG
jgi:DDE superfamily endonuclease